MNLRVKSDAEVEQLERKIGHGSTVLFVLPNQSCCGYDFNVCHALAPTEIGTVTHLELS